MNRLTKEIISELLECEDAWDKKTRKLRYEVVVDTYHVIRENRFYDEIFFPRMSRGFRLIRALGILPPEYFHTVLVDEHELLWIRDDLEDDYEWDISEHFFGEYTYTPTGKMRSTYFNRIWDSDDWAWEEPTIEEILELGIMPSIVPDKRYKNGVVQKALF